MEEMMDDLLEDDEDELVEEERVECCPGLEVLGRAFGSEGVEALWSGKGCWRQ